MITDLGLSISKSISNLFNKKIDDKSLSEAIDSICISLLEANVNPQYVEKLRKDLFEKVEGKKIPQGFNKARVVQNAVLESLTDLLDPKEKGYVLKKDASNVIVFVGLQGSGKTTSICKYANYYKKKGLKVGIVCADTFRAGAFDQVRQNALKIKVPFYGSEECDPVVVAGTGVARFKKEEFDLILVDTSGRHTQESELFKEMQEIMHVVKPDNIVFVMDAGIGQSAEDQAIGFKNSVNVGSIIITKVDGTTKAGGAISSVAATRCPIQFVGTGEGMEDFELFNAKRFVSRMLGMGDVEGLYEKVAELKIDEKEVVNKFKTGNFTLKDFYVQYQQLLSLGPMTKILEMIPGFSNLKIADESVFKRYMYIFDSLSKSELNSDGSIFQVQPTRIFRVARGSGTSVKDVHDLITAFKNLSGVMKKMASMPGFENMLTNDMQNLSPSQRAKLKKNARNILPKGMMDNLGGFF